jgi:hypothetical protein
MGLGIRAEKIFVSSLDGQGFDPVDNTREKIRLVIKQAKVIICVITTTYRTREVCMNELGAAWGLDKPLAALVVDEDALGSAAFLIDAQQQLLLSNPAKVAAIADILKEHDVLTTLSKQQLWTARLEIFQKGLRDLNIIKDKPKIKSIQPFKPSASNNKKNWSPDRLLKEGKLRIGDEVILWAATDFGIDESDPRIRATIKNKTNKCLRQAGSSDKHSFSSLRRTIIKELSLEDNLKLDFGFGVSKDWGIPDGRRLKDLV